MARTKQTLDDWINEALTDMDKGKHCTMMSLVHIAGGTAEKEIHSIKFVSGGKQWTAKELADLFDHKAHGYAQELVGVQLFTIHAFYGESVQPQASHPFRINGEHSYEGIQQTEGPTGQGLVQQSMRHTEAMTQMALRALAEANSMLREHSSQVSRENLELRRENFDAMKVVKEIVLNDMRERHTFEMQLETTRRNSALLERAVALAPALVNTITGKEVFTESKADTAILEELFVSLTPDQMRQMAGILPPKLVGLIMARAERYMKERAEKEKTDREALANLDPIKELTD
jgi:hypothetical protein